MRISLGVIIAIILIFVWYKHDHPDAVVTPIKAVGIHSAAIIRAV